MIKLFYGGKVFLEGKFQSADVLVIDQKIAKISSAGELQKNRWPVEYEEIDCAGLKISAGLVDPHMHLAGGSGEGGGFFSQSPQVLVSECIRGGVTTVVGTLGVDTTTRTMPDLLAKVKAYNEIGLTAFCYVGGYDVPPKTITGSVRDDLIFLPEVIGVGEIAIADRRAPEPSIKDLAKASVDAYVGGMLTGKAGVTHFHVGAADRRLKTVFDLMDQHTILPEKLYVTHVERSEALMKEAAQLSQLGGFIDVDIHDQDLHRWYRLYKNLNGVEKQFTVSSDAGFSSPADLWTEIRSSFLEHDLSLEEILPLFTANPARALNLNKKGRLFPGADADMVVFSGTDLELRHVLAGGRFMLRDGEICLRNRNSLNRRGYDIYEIHKN